MNEITLHQSISLSPQASAMAVELAKILKLVAPVSMDGTAQIAWIASAIDALEGIQVSEVAAVSAEVRRKVTRISQIIPMVTDLIAERRKRPANPGGSRTALEWAEGAKERGLMRHYEAWMEEARRRGEV